MAGSAPVESVYSVPFYCSNNTSKQKTWLTVLAGSSSVGASSFGIRCGSGSSIFGMANVTLSPGIALVLIIPLRGRFILTFSVSGYFPGNCVPIWISWMVILVVNIFQSTLLALQLMGKSCSGAYNLVGSSCTGSCANVLLLLHTPVITGS